MSFLRFRYDCPGIAHLTQTLPDPLEEVEFTTAAWDSFHALKRNVLIGLSAVICPITYLALALCESWIWQKLGQNLEFSGSQIEHPQ